MTKITPKVFKKALDGSMANYGIIAQRIGCTRGAITQYVQKHNLQDMIDEERMNLFDMAYNETAKKVKAGDWKAIERVLLSLGRKEGFGDHKELEHTGDLMNNITIEVSKADEPEPKSEPESPEDEA